LNNAKEEIRQLGEGFIDMFIERERKKIIKIEENKMIQEASLKKKKQKRMGNLNDSLSLHGNSFSTNHEASF
jgi:hypothetical protein